jgi:uncharacterized protein (TIGR02453 family)
MAEEFRETFAFLKALAAHNHKEWFDAHRDAYEREKKRFRAFVERLIKGIAGFAPEVADVEVKDTVFRINRDVRFAADKSPYKVNFAASISPGGRHSPFGNYYVHLQPGDQSFLGGGLYMPPNKLLHKIRQEIDYNPDRFLGIVNAPEFRAHFGALIGESLKTAPKGYPKDHPLIEYLRLKSFTVIKNFTDAEVFRDDFEQQVRESFRVMRDFNRFLSEAVDEVA